jgi:hypothetical protein
MVHSLDCLEIRRIPVGWKKMRRRNLRLMMASGFHLERLACDLAQEWNEPPRIWADFAGGLGAR